MNSAMVLYFLGAFVLAMILVTYHKFRPKSFFKGAVYVQFQPNLLDSLTITFQQPGRYHIAFLHPNFIRGPKPIAANRTILVKQVPYQEIIRSEQFPTPLTVAITSGNETESKTFNY